MKTVEKLARDCLELPVEQRMTLVRVVLEESERQSKMPGVEDAWDREIVARVEAVRNGTARGIDEGAVIAELDREFPG